MKQFFTRILCALLCMPCAHAQLPSKPANFGIDGDLYSNRYAAASTTAAGTDDWFRDNSGTGLGVIDTSSKTKWAYSVAYGQNLAFSAGMAFSRYSTQNSRLMLDARYARDYFGTDFTMFKSAKNGDAPSQWTITTSGSSILDKEDLIDAYIHMRRDGTTINNTNPSALVLNMGASTYGTTGDRYLDFELYRSRIYLDSATSKLVNAGSASTGGHSLWLFNTNGTIKQIGDMLISFSFNSAMVSEISAWIWVDGNTYNTINPTGFDFSKVSNNDYVGNSVSGVRYGYAKITPNPGQSFNLFGSVATTTVRAAPWGTNSKDIGYSAYNNFSFNYAPGQFAEVSLDLTRMGIDPALNGLMGDPCNPPFTRALVKSRASSSVASALKDFSGPYEFLDAPQPNALITTPQILTCARSIVSLSPANYQPSSYYQWSTADGNIIDQADPANTLINQPGTYTLTAAMVQGCTPVSQAVIVSQDVAQPAVKAEVLNMLMPNPAVYAQLKGTAGPSATDTKPSAGYGFSWTGPSGFQSSAQNPQTYVEGVYKLTANEQRNGCTATAAVTVQRSLGVLPLSLITFTGKLVNASAQLEWRVAGNETGMYFEMQKRVGAGVYENIGTIFTSEKTGEEQYHFSVNQPAQTQTYRLKLVNKDGSISFSKALVLQHSEVKTKLTLLQNPVQDVVRFTVPQNQAICAITIYSASGIIIYSQAYKSAASGTISINLQPGLPHGTYLLHVATQTTTNTLPFVKQ